MPDSGASTHRDVFVNCPFDSDYKQQFNALIFTIYDCGFYPRCALEAVDSGQLRFQKICQLILKSPYGIHDLSRIELDPSTQLPRFNMALAHLSQFLTLNLHKWLILRTHDRAKGLRLSPQKRFWSRFNTRRCTVRFLSIRIVSLNQ